MANDLDLRLRIRVDNDGTAQVLNNVGRNVRNIGEQADTAADQLNRMDTAGRASGGQVSAGAQSAGVSISEMAAAADAAAVNMATAAHAAAAALTDIGAASAILEAIAASVSAIDASLITMTSSAAAANAELLAFSTTATVIDALVVSSGLLNAELLTLTASSTSAAAALATLNTLTTASVAVNALGSALNLLNAGLVIVTASAATALSTIEGLALSSAAASVNLGGASSSASATATSLSEITAAAVSLTALTSSASALDAALLASASSAATFNLSVSTLSASAAVLDAAIATSSASIGILGTAVGGLTSTVGVLDSALATSAATASALSVSLGTLTTSASALDAALLASATSLSALNVALGSLTASVGVLDAAIVTTATSITALSTSLRALTTTAGALDTALAASAASAAAFGGAFGTLIASAGALDAALATLTASAAGATTALNRLGTAADGQVAAGTTAAKTGIQGMVAALVSLISGLVAVKEIATFETKMNEVESLTFATAEGMDALAKAARVMGATTAFSAKEAAEGEAELASAGLQVNEILYATPKVLNLASAGNLNLAHAAEIAMGTIKGLGLSLGDLPRVNDVLAKTAADSQANVEKLGDALQQVAPLARLSGISLEEVSAALGILANNNIKGATAGDQLKSMLAKLSDATKPTIETLAQYGLTLGDININARGLPAVLLTLQQANFSTADTFQLFGTEAAAVGTILSKNQEELVTFASNLKNAEGAADKAAQILNKGLAKSFDALLGVTSEAALQFGEAGLTKSLTEVIVTTTGVISVWEGMGQQFAASNGLTATEAQHLQQLAGSVNETARAAAGLAIGIGVVIGAMKAFDIAMITSARLAAINPFTGLMVSLGALIGLIATAKSDLLSLTDAQSQLTQIDADIAHQREKLAVMQNEGFVGRAIDIVTGNSIAETTDQLALLANQRKNVVKTLDDEKAANESAVKATVTKAMADAQAAGAAAKATAATQNASGASKNHKAVLSDAAKAAQQLANEYERLIEQMERQKALNGDTSKLVSMSYDLEHTKLAALSEVEKQRLLQLAYAQDKQDEARKSDEARKNMMQQLIDKYDQLTMSAKDYQLASLTPKTLSLSDYTTEKITTQIDVNADLDKQLDKTNALRDVLQSYDHSLDSAKNSMTDFGSIASSSLDGALGGVSAVAGAFATMLDGINQNTAALGELGKKQWELAHFKMADPQSNAEQYAKDVQLKADLSKKFAAEQAALTARSTQLQLAGFGQIAGAAKGLFNEQSTGYKALQAAEQTFRAFEMAVAFEAFLTKQGYLLSWLGIDTATKATATATETAYTATAVGESGVRAMAYGTEAYANTLASVPFPFNLAAGAAVLAALVAAGVAIFGGGSSGYDNLAVDRQDTQGTGTVLGDAKAQSESINKALETIRDIDIAALPLTAQMAKSLRNIENGIGGLSVYAAKNITGDNSGLFNLQNSTSVSGAGQFLSGQNLAGQIAGGIGAALSTIGLIEGVANLVLGTVMASFSNLLLPGIGLILGFIPGVSDFIASGFETQSKVQDTGITVPKQTFASIWENGLQAEAYADIEKIEHFFWFETSRSLSRMYQSLSQSAMDSMTGVLTGIAGTVAAGAQLLGISGDQLKSRIGSFVVDIGDISLKGLSGEDITKQLDAVFSKVGDQLTTYIVPQIEQFQKTDEGLLQTLVRVATGVEQARVSLQALNVTAVAYTDIVNKQGDVFEETVRQSIVAVEQYKGVLNGVGQIIDALDASGEDLISTYKTLVQIRNLMQATGINGDILDTSVIGGAGGLDTLKSGLSTYHDKYFTEQEQLTAHTIELINAFAALNTTMPDSRDGFRALVTGIDTSTAAGKTLLGQVLQLADGFDTLQTQYESVLNTLQDNVTSAYDTAAELLQKQIDTFSDYATSLQKFSDSLITGDLSTATPGQKYQAARQDFVEIKNVLATGTDEQKQTALGDLQSVAQAYLTASRGYNASGAGYIKDFADVQGVLATAITESQQKTDVAEAQLDALTEQLTALGLIKTSVDDVTTAVNAVGIALAGLDAFKAAQAASKVKTANEAAFDSIESARKQTYESTIAVNAGKVGTAAGKYETMLGFSAGTSKNAFSASGSFDAGSGAITSDIATTAGGGNAGSVQTSLHDDLFPRLVSALTMVGQKVQSVVGGALPSVAVKFGDDQEYGPGYFEYAFGSVSKRINTDQLPAIERSFANDITDYLANQLTNTAWIEPIKAVDYSSLATGFTELATVMAKLKNPFVEGTYHPEKDYTQLLDGSHKDGLAHVPFDGYFAELHYGERVLTAQEAAIYNSVANAVVNDTNSLFTDWYQPIAQANYALSVNKTQQSTHAKAEAQQRIEITIERPDWLYDTQASTSSFRGREDDRELLKQLKNAVEELKKANKILIEQSRHLAAGVAVDQAGYTKLIATMQKQIDELEKANRGQRIVKVKL